MQDLTRIMKQAQPNCSENHAYSLAALFEYLNLKPDIGYFVPSPFRGKSDFRVSFQFMGLLDDGF